MENKVYVMTAKQIAKAFPRDKELHARLKALQDSGFEPYIDDEHPDLSDEARMVKPSIFESILKKLRSSSKIRKKEARLA